MAEPVRLVVCDIEGCLIPVRKAWDLVALAAVGRYAARSRERPEDFPPMVLCSGRPPQFVEALQYAIGLTTPAVCENGALIYEPEPGTVEWLVTPEQRGSLQAAGRLLAEEFARARGARLAHGKAACVTLVPPAGGGDPAALCREVQAFLDARLGPGPGRLEITYSTSAVDITPAGVTKARAVAVLAERWGMPMAAVLAIGDGGNDLELLRAAGHSAAPAKALPEVTREVQYLSPEPVARGVLDILRHFTGYRS